jgi:predicted ABC-type ATPase
MAPSNPPTIFVLAGVNGAGKSSFGGEMIRAGGFDYFNPDEAARRIQAMNGCTVEEANGLAWAEGKRRLESAMECRLNYAFESTLAGRTIPSLLIAAARAGIEVVVWFIGLSSQEQHIARVRARVAAGGHDIPEEMIRTRWSSSRRNIITLMPHLAELQVFDNSEEGQPNRVPVLAPRLVLHWRNGQIGAPAVEELGMTPEWAKAIVASALRLHRSHL